MNSLLIFVFNSPSFWKIFLLSRELCWQIFSFPRFEDVIPLFSHLHNLWQEVSVKFFFFAFYAVYIFSPLVSRFLLCYSTVWKWYIYRVFSFSYFSFSFYTYPSWWSLNFLRLRPALCYLSLILEILSHYPFKLLFVASFPLSSPSGILTTCMFDIVLQLFVALFFCMLVFA